MIKEIVDLRRGNVDATRLVVPASRSEEFVRSVRGVMAEFGDPDAVGALETFMGLSVRLGLGDRLMVK